MRAHKTREGHPWQGAPRESASPNARSPYQLTEPRGKGGLVPIVGLVAYVINHDRDPAIGVWRTEAPQALTSVAAGAQ